jgi:hypothetical protein
MLSAAEISYVLKLTLTSFGLEPCGLRGSHARMVLCKHRVEECLNDPQGIRGDPNL